MYTSFSNSTSTASTSISSGANWNGHNEIGNIVEGEGLEVVQTLQTRKCGLVYCLAEIIVFCMQPCYTTF